MIEWYDLNARHEAIVLWGGAFLFYVISTSSGVRESCWDLLKRFLQRTILLSFMGFFLVVVVLATVAVSIGRHIGLWDTLPVVALSVWTLGSGVGLLMNMDKFLEKKGEFKRASTVLTPASIVAALASIAILPIWWEIALLPLLVVLSLLVVHNESRERDHRLYGATKTLTVLYTLVIASLAIKNIVEDPNTWKPLAQGVLLPVCLTIGVLPYIRVLLLVEQWRFRFRCPSRVVSSSEYGLDWPLTVESATLCCKHSAVWVEVNGKKYGVNGTSRGLLSKWGHTCFDLMEIWKDHPSIEEGKVSVHRIIQDGLALEHR